MTTEISIRAVGPQGSGKTLAIDELMEFMKSKGWKFLERRQELAVETLLATRSIKAALRLKGGAR